MLPLVFVIPASKMHDAGSVTMSVDTIGSSVYWRIPFIGPSAACLTTALISSLEAAVFSSTVRSVAEPVGTGTRMAYPSSLPFKCGRTRAIAFAAPVLVGIMFIAAARARRRSLCGKSRIR